MILTYEKNINDTDQFDAIPIIKNFLKVLDVVNGNIDDDNISNSADLTIEKIETTDELVAGKYEFGKSQEIPEDKIFSIKSGSENILTITAEGVTIG